MILFDHLLPISGKKDDFRIAQGTHLEKWRPRWNSAWPALFSCRVIPLEECCLYHNLKDSSEICNYLLHKSSYPHYRIPFTGKMTSLYWNKPQVVKKIHCILVDPLSAAIVAHLYLLRLEIISYLTPHNQYLFFLQDRPWISPWIKSISN